MSFRIPEWIEHDMPNVYIMFFSLSLWIVCMMTSSFGFDLEAKQLIEDKKTSMKSNVTIKYVVHRNIRIFINTATKSSLLWFKVYLTLFCTEME
jgi:hypothetical protein